MKLKANVWLTDSYRNEYLRATSEEERAKFVHFDCSTKDMSSCWTKLGTAEIEIKWESTSNVREQEVARVDSQITQLELACRKEVIRLREYRSTLLCLEAPKSEVSE